MATYSATTVLEGQEILVKLVLLQDEAIRRPPFDPQALTDLAHPSY